ncbi:sulfite oxidase heme-binding subunit YedZ [Nisaea sp.]|uniref:sulfite oxidase heme-binding subunit YedZ n=1 Tax=Nisaea sp. TaxID=2024842 RepID=UPI003B52EEF8
MTSASIRRKPDWLLSRHLPWTDRTGRLICLKLGVFLALLAPALLLLFDSAADALGARPWEAATHRAGWWSVTFLMLSLAVTPVRRILRWGELMTVRRMIGVTVFLAAMLHLTLYAGMQSWNLPKLASEIALRIYLTIGFVALLGLGALAATSTDGMVRRLGGRRWRILHQLVYPIALLALVHFFLQSKNDVTEPILFAGFFAWLMGYRLWHWRFGPPAPSGLAILALAAAISTAAGEIACLSLKYPVTPWVMLKAHFDFGAGLRPAWWVVLVGSALAVAAEIRRPKARLDLEPALPPDSRP